MRLFDNATEMFTTQEYPATTTDLIDSHGHLTLELPNGSETIADVLGRMTEETYDNAEEARLATYSAVSQKAIGRKGYSDRDPICMGEDGPDEVSF
ncbi:DUF2795 domain-containing protein [Halobacteriales archaeon QS_4_62_28]|nr:MAG: DUF2795 domain-containing protein [Halobacteriales archaeon QS_4_62_28]